MSDEIIQAATDLVLMWEYQKIEGLPRSERNAAIEEIRSRLTKAVLKRQADLGEFK